MTRFFKEHFKLTVIVTVVMVLIILITTSFFFDFSNFFVNKTIQKTVSIVQAPFTKAGDGIAGGVKGIFGFRKVMIQNEEMKKEIADLNKEIIGNKLASNELEELRNLSNALNYLQSVPEYDYVTGDVIAQDGSNWLSTFTVNVGEKQGVAKDDVVINGDGLVGRVSSVGGSWAKVVTIIDDSGAVSFRISRSIEFTGMLRSNGEGGMEGYLIDPEADIVAGDVLITSGLGLYPQGITIGKVEDLVSDNDRLLKTIKIKPSANFSSISKVTIIKKR